MKSKACLCLFFCHQRMGSMKEKGILEMVYLRDCRFWTYDNQRRNNIVK